MPTAISTRRARCCAIRNSVPGLSDGGAHCGIICDASFPTYLLTHWTRDRTRGEKLSIPFVVAAQSRKTALSVGLYDRGVIAPGFKADVNVIDYDKLHLHPPKVHYDLPVGGRRLMQQVDGYDATIVSGVVTQRGGRATGARPGKLVRGTQGPQPKFGPRRAKARRLSRNPNLTARSSLALAAERGAALAFPMPGGYNLARFSGGADVHFGKQIRSRNRPGGALSGRRTAHAQAAPVPYWSPGWPIGFGGTLPPSKTPRQRYNFPNGMFVGSTSSNAGLNWNGLNQAGAFGNFGSLRYEGMQFGYNFGSGGGLPVTLFGGSTP